MTDDASGLGPHIERYEQEVERARELEADGDDQEAAIAFRTAAGHADVISNVVDSREKTVDWRDMAYSLRLQADALDGGDSASRSDAENPFRPPGDGREAASDRVPGDDSPPTGPPGDRDLDESDHFEEAPDLDFDDVVGYEDVKEQLEQDIIVPFREPDHWDRLEVAPVHGTLLIGAPGNGKSLFAKAVAGELGFPMAFIGAEAVASKWVGEAPKNVVSLFEEARQQAPCVIVIDEIESLVPQRDSGRQQTMSEEQMIDKFLTEMQQLEDDDEQVLVLGTTNFYERIDTAVKRSGRFDTEIEVPPPDEQTRIDLLDHYLPEAEVNHDQIDWEYVAHWTKGYACSDMKSIAETACRRCAWESTRDGTAYPVRFDDIVDALSQTSSSLEDWPGVETRTGSVGSGGSASAPADD